MRTKLGLCLLGAFGLACNDTPAPDASEYAAALSRAPATAGPNPVAGARGVAPGAADMPTLRPGSAAAAMADVTDEDIEAAKGCAPGNESLRGVTEEFPWARAKNGGLWQGTGTPDHPDLQVYSDEALLKLAMDTQNKTVDREHALVSLGRRKLPGSMEAFEIALATEEEHAVREMALSGLIEHGGAKALELMWRALRTDPSSQIRGMAIWAVALYGETEAHSAIMHGLSDEAISVQNMALLAVWALKDKPEIAIPILEGALKDPRPMIWQEAHYNLGRLPYIEAGQALKRAVVNATDEMQKASAVGSYRGWQRKFPEMARLCD